MALSHSAGTSASSVYLRNVRISFLDSSELVSFQSVNEHVTTTPPYPLILLDPVRNIKTARNCFLGSKNDQPGEEYRPHIPDSRKPRGECDAPTRGGRSLGDRAGRWVDEAGSEKRTRRGGLRLRRERKGSGKQEKRETALVLGQTDGARAARLRRQDVAGRGPAGVELPRASPAVFSACSRKASFDTLRSGRTRRIPGALPSRDPVQKCPAVPATMTANCRTQGPEPRSPLVSHEQVALCPSPLRSLCLQEASPLLIVIDFWGS